MRISPATLAFLIPLAVSALASAQDAERSRETLFVFDWPAGARADVVASRTLENQLRRSRTHSEARFELAVSRTGPATTVTSRALSFSPIRERLEEDAANAALVATMYLPSLELTRDGALAGVRDPDAATGEIEGALAQAVPEVVRSAPVWQLAASSWSTPPAIEAAAAGIVGTLTSSLAGRTLVVGRPLEGEGASELIVQGIVVPQRTTLALERTLPCFQGDAADRCAEVTMHSVPDATVLGGLARRIGMRSLEVTMSAVLVTEPRTLLPHRCEVRTRRAYAVEIEGVVRDIVELETRTWVFTYRRETIRAAAR